MGSIIKMKGLRKSYTRGKQDIPVLDGIDLEIDTGAFEALMGPSGSGKTTLLNLIAGIDRPTSGSLEVAGTDITRLSEGELATWRSQNIGFISGSAARPRSRWWV
jgi:putative ABC transport system ATP-binding protein